MSNICLWAYLPNAKHIDAVIAHVTAHPTKWADAWYNARPELSDIAWNDTWNDTWDSVTCIARNELVNSLWDAIPNISDNTLFGDARYAANNAARDAILALTAYDDCAYLLDSAPDELRVIIALSGDTNPAAILLLSAVIVFHKDRHMLYSDILE